MDDFRVDCGTSVRLYPTSAPRKDEHYNEGIQHGNANFIGMTELESTFTLGNGLIGFDYMKD